MLWAHFLLFGMMCMCAHMHHGDQQFGGAVTYEGVEHLNGPPDTS